MPAEESKAHLLATMIYLSEWQRNYFNQADDDVWGTGKVFFQLFTNLFVLVVFHGQFFQWLTQRPAYVALNPYTSFTLNNSVNFVHKSYTFPYNLEGHLFFN